MPDPTPLDKLAALNVARRPSTASFATEKAARILGMTADELRAAHPGKTPDDFDVAKTHARRNVPPIASRTDRIASLRQEMRELGAGMLDEALSSAEALVRKLRELAEAPSDAVSDGQRDAAGKLAADLDSRVTTMRQIQARAV